MPDSSSIIKGDSLKRSHFKMEGQIEAQKRKKSSLHSTNQQPRWHNQAYMLYMALRQHSEKTMARTDLIKSALAIDKRISEERHVPKVFRGKTPMNSASAILTNNSDRYFIPFKPEGSKSMHFRLSFEPGNFESAFKEYNEWQKKLVELDWPAYFGGVVEQKLKNDMTVVKELDISHNTYLTEFDEFIAKRKKARLEKENIHYTKTIGYTPKSWQEIISLRKSNHNYGLFANRNLPRNMPLGFYFGVPMTEDEFDSMKDGIGEATKYCYLYKRKTVIDPTDNYGNLFTLNGSPLCPFHYIKETSIYDKANIVFYEGNEVNQIICWTKKEIAAGDELFIYAPEDTTITTTTTMIPQPQQPNILRPVPILPQQVRNISSSTNNNNNWQKKPSISSMLNTTSISTI